MLDFATSRIAQGKTRVAHNQGKPLAPGTIIDDKGDPTTNPRFTVIPPYGAILPFGEHKGYGLAVAAELLGGALAAGATQNFADEGKRRVLNGMLTIIIDPKQLGAGDGFARETEAFIDWCLASPPGPDVDRVKLAGDPEREKKKQRGADGIAVDPATWEEILVSADKLQLQRADVRKLAGV